MQRYHGDTLMQFIWEGSRVLDVGCNSGGFGYRLRNEWGCVYFGVDLKSWWDKQIGNFHSKEEAEKMFFVCQAEELRKIFNKEEFDVVVAAELLEHVYEVDPVMWEMTHVLKPGGRLVGSVPHHLSPRGNKRYERDDDSHLREFNEESLTDLLLEHNYKNIKIVPSIRVEDEPNPHYHVFMAEKI
ncbi:MAG: class I SAM-dependent methyltransferase [Perlabentimonas sp.]